MNGYFSHDSNARNSNKLLRVRMELGAAGYGIYFMLLERLRDEDDYMSIKDYNAIAFDLRVDASQIKAVVENFGLFAFTENGKYFYSEGFNKRMSIKDEKTKRRAAAGKKGASKRWNKDKNGNAIAKPSTENGNAIAKPPSSDGKESKVKERKEKGSKKEITENDTLMDFIDFWDEYPKKEKKQDASKAYYEARLGGASVDELLQGAKRYAKFIKATHTFSAMASNWLDDSRWSDEYDMTPHQQANSRGGFVASQSNSSFDDSDIPF
ncbi:Lin1244/Lin1753 domain-containing protein [Secundilactobacillus collinoides]|nr:Lin1244/Lin1753 domain-containing protein [Secundilactobacillus collinoides]